MSKIWCDLQQLLTSVANNFEMGRDIDKRWMALSTTISLALNKKMANFGSLTPEITQLMFTHPKSTVHILRMLMYLSSGHVTLLRGELHPPTRGVTSP